MENGYKCSNSKIYEDFVPTSELVHGKDYDTLLLNLPGFKKEEIKIELCKTEILKISGQRPVNKFLSFEKDIHVPTNCDKTKINAKLLNGILYVKHPNLIIPSEKNENENKNKNKLPSTTNNEPKQDNKKPKLDELNKQDNAEQDNKKPELDELNKQDNAEHSPAKQEQPKNNEQTQVVKPDESMKDATTPSASDLAKLKVSRNVINIALAALVVLGIGCYVINMMISSKKACVLLQFKF